VIGRRPLLVLFALALPLVPRDLAAQLIPASPEQRVETREISSLHDCPRLAVAPDRSFAIAWDYAGEFAPGRLSATAGDDSSQDSLGKYRVYARHFGPDGEPTEAEQVAVGPSVDTSGHNVLDLLTPLPDGFEVYVSRNDVDNEHYAVDFRQKLDLDGKPVGPLERLRIGLFPVAGPAGSLYFPIHEQRRKNLAIQQVTVDGKLEGRRIVLNTRPIYAIYDPTIAPQDGGNFVAAWSGFVAEKHPRWVLRARVVRGGTAIGKDFDLNVIPGGRKGGLPILQGPYLTADPSTGRFAAIWLVLDGAGRTSIHFRIFDAEGRPLSPETVAVPAALPVSFLAAALDDSGHLLLLWRPPLGDVLRARLFAADGTPLGAAVQLKTTPGSRSCGAVAWAGDSWLITWLGRGDGEGNAVVWRRFTE
jgi:hypothetical protein